MPKERTSSGQSSDLPGSELFETFREMSRNWIERASAEAELGFKLTKDLNAARSVPDAVAACQEWLTKEMDSRAEDARQFMSDGQKLMDTNARLLREMVITSLLGRTSDENTRSYPDRRCSLSRRNELTTSLLQAWFA